MKLTYTDTEFDAWARELYYYGSVRYGVRGQVALLRYHVKPVCSVVEV